MKLDEKELKNKLKVLKLLSKIRKKNSDVRKGKVIFSDFYTF